MLLLLEGMCRVWYYKNLGKNLELLSDALEIIKGSNTQHDEIPFYMNIADIFVPTSLIEGSANVVKEVMVCNCPVIWTDAGDPSQVIGNTDVCHGVNFNPKDVADKFQLSLKLKKMNNG